MNTGNNRAEYSTTQKAEGKFLLMRIGLAILFVAIVVVSFVVDLRLVLAPISLTVCFILYLVLWRYTKPDYKYVIESGDMNFYRNYSAKKDNLVFKTKVKEMEIIAPYTSEYDAPAKASDISTTYDFRGTTKPLEDAYFAVFTKDGKKCAVLFECTEKAAKLFVYYNKQNAVVKESYRH